MDGWMNRWREGWKDAGMDGGPEEVSRPSLSPAPSAGLAEGGCPQASAAHSVWGWSLQPGSSWEAGPGLDAAGRGQ